MNHLYLIRCPSLIIFIVLQISITIVAAYTISDPIDKAAFCVILEIPLSGEATKAQGTPTCRRDHRRAKNTEDRKRRGACTRRNRGKAGLAEKMASRIEVTA